MKRKNIICILLFAIIFQFFIFCTNQKNKNFESKTLNIAISSNPTNLDSRYAFDMASQYIANQIYRSLFIINEKLEIANDIVQSYIMTDTVTYIISIDSEVYFSNGKNLTAADIKYTYSSIIDSTSISPFKKSFDYLKNIEVIDKYKIKFSLLNSFAPFLSNLTIGIVPENLAGKSKSEFCKTPVGAGPFEIAEWKQDDKLILKRNKFFTKHKIIADKLVFKILADDNTRYFELINGDIDIAVNNIPQDMIANLKRNKNLKIITDEGLNYSYLGFNCENKILKNKKIRQAISSAINRDDIIKNILNGYAKKATNILNPDHWASDKNIKIYDYNIELSNKLLDEAGYKMNKNGIRFSLEYKALNRDITGRIAEVIQAQLRNVGIEIKIRMYEWGAFYGDIVKGNFEMFQLSWVGIIEPDIYYIVFHSKNIPPNGSNRGRYKNKEIDRIVEAARYELDIEKRKILYYEIEKIISEDCPYVSLWYNTNINILSSKIKYFKTNPIGDLKYLYLTEF